jgi:hypothetical protein
MVFATGCVDHVWSQLRESFERSPVAGEIPKVSETVRLLWAVSTNSESEATSRLGVAVAELEESIPEDDDPKIAVLGWSNLLNAAVYAAQAAQLKEPELHAYLVADYSYQSIFEWRIFPQIDGQALIDDQVAALERADPVCMSEIDFQLYWLGKVERDGVNAR